MSAWGQELTKTLGYPATDCGPNRTSDYSLVNDLTRPNWYIRNLIHDTILDKTKGKEVSVLQRLMCYLCFHL